MAEAPWMSSTVAIRPRRFACRVGQRFAGQPYQTVLTAEASDRPLFTERSVVRALSGMAVSVQRTRMDWATCSAWPSGLESSRSISDVKSVAEARVLGCVSILFQGGSELGGPESSALLRAKRDRTPGYCGIGLWREISAFHCWSDCGQGAGRRVSAWGRIWQRRAFLRWAA